MTRFCFAAVFFALRTFSVSAFNFDLDPVIKEAPDRNTYFGFSVALHQDQDNNPWILVGAPLGHNSQPNTNRSGALYKCPVVHNGKDCVQVATDGYRDAGAKYHLDYVDDELEEKPAQMPPGQDEIKEDQWLGVTVRSQKPGGKVAVCAHRYIQGDNIQQNQNGYGLCYVLSSDMETLEFAEEPCKGKPINKFHQQYGLCQVGTSLDFLQDGNLLMGAPGPFTWRGTIFTTSVVGEFLDRDTLVYRGPLSDTSAPIEKYSYLGMSVTGGKFFDKNRYTYVSGAPRSNYTGQVYFFEKNQGQEILNISMILNGESFASSFGYEMLAVDIDNDGFDDLVVSAPFYYDENHGGKIYLYMNLKKCLEHPNEPCIPDKTLSGEKFSRFGFSLASVGDINRDGFNDIAVGAPYENKGRGAVYIYLGKKDGVKGEPQIITHKRAKTLGYSLSGGLDMDSNGYPDLAVGAYESDAVLLYKTLEIINIDITVYSKDKDNINVMKKGCEADKSSNNTCFSFRSCIKFTEKPEKNLNLRYSIYENSTIRRIWFRQEKYEGKSNRVNSTLTIKHLEHCTEMTAYIEEYVGDFLKPIQLVAQYTLDDSRDQKYILNKTSTKSFTATFQKNCGNDDICNSDLQLKASTHLKKHGDGTTYTAFSTKEELLINVNIENKKEDAYEAKLFIDHPEELSYIALKVDNNKNSSTVKCSSYNKTLVQCDLGNPMKSGKTEEETLRFEIISSATSVLNVKVYVNTSSIDLSMNTRKEFSIVLQKMADFTLIAKATSNLFYRSDGIRGESAMSKLEDIGPRITHVYEIENGNEWDLTNFTVDILWPYQVESRNERAGKWLLYLEATPMWNITTGNGSVNVGACVVEEPKIVNPLKLTGTNQFEEPENLLDSRTTYRRRRSSDEKSRFKRDIEYIVPAKLKKVNEKVSRVVEMNCLSADPDDPASARCVKIQCKVDRLEKNLKVKFEVRSRLWNSTLAEDYKTVDWISIKSRAKINLDKEFILKNNTLDYAAADTKLYPESIQTSLSYWYIIVAVLIGILLLVILIVVLWKCGFFKRNRHTKDPTLKGAILSSEEKEPLKGS
ncbi:unnamed protein product [Brassicogethes aeneus]|uniref:Uncharacterized protein n=1 Tax=Brassicogethes aeneus TaxID=1431903 RepID=A0A9P0BFL4_BRAAE|nr:unnamed protein product [Brassicogethes aeneus]